jgi:hypothetical protein
MDVRERYRARAELYLERAREAKEPTAVEQLLHLAEYWLVRAEQAYENARRQRQH